MGWRYVKLPVNSALLALHQFSAITKLPSMAQSFGNGDGVGVFKRGALSQSVLELFFTPAAARLFGQELAALNAQVCDPPAADESIEAVAGGESLTLVFGDEGVKRMLRR